MGDGSRIGKVISKPRRAIDPPSCGSLDAPNCLEALHINLDEASDIKSEPVIPGNTFKLERMLAEPPAPLVPVYLSAQRRDRGLFALAKLKPVAKLWAQPLD